MHLFSWNDALITGQIKICVHAQSHTHTHVCNMYGVQHDRATFKLAMTTATALANNIRSINDARYARDWYALYDDVDDDVLNIQSPFHLVVAVIVWKKNTFQSRMATVILVLPHIYRVSLDGFWTVFLVQTAFFLCPMCANCYNPIWWSKLDQYVT